MPYPELTLTYHWIGPHNIAVRNIVPFVSTGAALIITPLVSLLTSGNQHQKIWDVLSVKHNEDEEMFHVFPRTLAGRLALAIVFLGLATFCAGVVCAHWNCESSSWLAVCGMLAVFAGGGLRVVTN